jgi:hypothetical protein
MTVAEGVVRAGKVAPGDEKVRLDEMLVFLIEKVLWLEDDAFNDIDDSQELCIREKDFARMEEELRVAGSKLTSRETSTR